MPTGFPSCLLLHFMSTPSSTREAPLHPSVQISSSQLSGWALSHLSHSLDLTMQRDLHGNLIDVTFLNHFTDFKFAHFFHSTHPTVHLTILLVLHWCTITPFPTVLGATEFSSLASTVSTSTGVPGIWSAPGYG